MGGEEKPAWGEIELGKPRQTRVRPPVGPSEPFVPNKVMQDCGFDGESGCEQVIQSQARLQQRQHAELNSHADSTDGVEFQPAYPPARGCLSRPLYHPSS